MKKLFFKFIFVLLLFTPLNANAADCSPYKKWSKEWRVCKYCNTGVNAPVCKIIEGGKVAEEDKSALTKAYNKLLKDKKLNFKNIFKPKKFDESTNTQQKYTLISENLKKLNINLPDAPAPVGAYVAFKKVNNLLFISGQLPIASDGKMIKGKIGKDLKLEDGQEAAKLCVINILSQAKKALDGDINKIKGCAKITGYVNSTDDFTNQPKVINPASETISSLLGEKGKHTRAAVSTNSLPLGAAVEIDAIFEIQLSAN